MAIMNLRASKIGVGARYLACIAATAAFAGVAYASGRELNQVTELAEIASTATLRNNTALLYLGAAACSAIGAAASLIQTFRTYRMPKEASIDKSRQTITHRGRTHEYAALLNVRETRGPLERFTGCRTLKVEALIEKKGTPRILRFRLPYQRTRAGAVTEGTTNWKDLLKRGSVASA